jgi:hypothetical protein
MKTTPTPTIVSPPVLDAGLENGLKRLKLSTIRRIAPDMLITAKTQREETLRTLSKRKCQHETNQTQRTE